ncbi:DUF4362 domain-containing protein [Bacillus pseudomycoides]|uniref:DUF4362 domain-containing protein n=1 Tax=Bacillus pseudomycoides TaxID=64104 RepID=UPI000BF6015B|nr:DUF4362 domain-containing protein [Bacillus pseudomycoides]PGE94246.1 DUF4362 domain-containing protein [Bacillus pseudomycoides]PHB16094.1 DUF4362 domain-containing protein [Bacillus pseudomycoides]PHE28900.1 DUF4362 domain-containing protein [Bacillus pseudomycoides]
MKKPLIVGALCLALTSLTACSNDNEKSSTEVKKDEIVIHIPKEKSKNLERFGTFSQNVKNKKNYEIQIKNYLTDEEAKVPTLETVTYKDEKFTFTYKYKNDYRKDICNKLVTPQETHGIAYMLRDCAQSEEGIVLHNTAEDGEGIHSIKDKSIEFIEVEGDKTYIFVKQFDVGAFVNAIQHTNFNTLSNTSNTQKSNYKVNVHFLSGTTQTYYLWIDKEKSQGIIMDSEQTNQGHEIDKIFVDDIIKVLN